FFFQAEDGIRDRNVTGVQTCALPILRAGRDQRDPPVAALPQAGEVPIALGAAVGAEEHQPWRRERDLLRLRFPADLLRAPEDQRSEERRVGKECRSWWAR